MSPLSRLPHLQLLQIGSYTIPTATQLRIVQRLSTSHSSLLVVGLMGEEGETHWWGIWRRASVRWSSSSSGSASSALGGPTCPCPQPGKYSDTPMSPRSRPPVEGQDQEGRQEGEVAYDNETDIVVAPLEIGHLRTLEADAERLGRGGRRSSILEHRRFSLTDPIHKGKRRQSGVAPMIPMMMDKRQRRESNGGTGGGTDLGGAGRRRGSGVGYEYGTGSGQGEGQGFRGVGHAYP